MALPAVLGLATGLMRGAIPAARSMGFAPSGGGGFGAILGAVAGGAALKKRRRRRARLTQGDKMELSFIASTFGKTAAANALPYYLGRGRG